MAYELDDFCEDCKDLIDPATGKKDLDAVRNNLEKLCQNQEFVDATCGPDAKAGVHTLYRDADKDFMVLSHINAESRTSPPHDHGASWAIYGQAGKHTDMKVYNRIGGASGAGEAKLEVTQEFRLNPGQAGLFDVGEIHAIDHPKGASFVRVTGTDLNHVERLRFDEEKGTAEVIEDQGVPHPDKA